MKTYPMVALTLAAALTVGGITLSTGYADAKSDGKTTTAVTPTDSSVKEKLTDSSFVEKAALSNVEKAELSKLALQKSENKKLKKFAQKIVDSSSASMQKLQTIASENRLEAPAQLQGDQKNMIAQVQQLNGAEFDVAYTDLMKKTQDSAVALFDNAVGEGTLNATLRVYANQQLPSLRENQKLAHALKPTTGQPSASTKPKRELSGN